MARGKRRRIGSATRQAVRRLMDPDAGPKLEIVVDGYNFLRAYEEGGLSRGPRALEKAREAMISWIAHRTPRPENVTIVFDAPERGLPNLSADRLHSTGIRLVFAVGPDSADDRIAELCRSHSAPKQLLVISNDHEVRDTAHARSATALRCELFEAILRRRSNRSPDDSRPIEPPQKHHGPGQQDADHWLEFFQNIDGFPEQRDSFY